MHPAMEKGRDIVDAVHIEETGVEATCTSAFRPQSPGGSSLHPRKQACDLRTWAFGDPFTQGGKDRVRAFAKKLRARLGPDYDVVVEGPAAERERYATQEAYEAVTKRIPHVHWEYDPR